MNQEAQDQNLPTSDIVVVTHPGESQADGIRSFLQEMLPSCDETIVNPVVTAIVPWMCDVLASNHSITGYLRDIADFFNQLIDLGINPFEVRADHVKVYKAALLRNGVRPGTIARKLSVIRGVYRQFADKEHMEWNFVQAICAVKTPRVTKNTTPVLTQAQAVALLRAIPRDTPKGIRDFALLQTIFSTGCRVSAVVRARVGDVEFDGVEHYLHVTEKRNKEARKILLAAARPILDYLEAAKIVGDRKGPLFRPLSSDQQTFAPRHMNRKTPWRLVKKYCRLAGIETERLQSRGIGVHSLRKTAITEAIRNGANMHEVREFAGHSDIRTTELYYARRDEDAEHAARRVQIQA